MEAGSARIAVKHVQSGKYPTKRCSVRLLSLVCCCVLLVLPASAQAWQVVEHDGRDYVTLKSIAQFYGFELEMDGRHLCMRAERFVVEGAAGSQDLLINKIKFVLSYPVVLRAGHCLVSRIDLCKLIDPVLRPHGIRNAAPFRTVVIDPGHGGRDAGAVGLYGNEKEFTMRLALQLKSDLEHCGFGVVLTRDEDRYLTLAERVAIANRVDDAIFVSLHFNYGAATARGLETFALSPFGAESTYAGPAESDFRSFSGNRRDAENIALATAVHVATMKATGAVDRGIKRARWAVLREINKPAILFEGGFLTHEEEARKIASTTYLETLAVALAEAITKFCQAVGR
jgi:N-acetylmuramoyl-L-alanine amidase